MNKFALLMTLASALPLAACTQTVPASECDGWARLTPNAASRGFLIVQDRPLAEQIAAHNEHGRNRNCW